MGMLDGKYWVIYLAGGLEGVVEAGEDTFDRILEVLRSDYQESRVREIANEEFDLARFDLALKFDTYTLVWNGQKLSQWYAVNVQKLA